MADPTSIPAPNYTQIPNAIFELMADKDAHLKEAELRVILAIARKTFGWHKKRDKISLTQLEEMTAMSRTSVIAGLDAAISRGLVRKTPDKKDKRGGFFYELVVEEPNDITSTKSGLVQNLNQSKINTRTSPKFEPELVQNLDTQKKDKEKKERGGESPALTPAVQAYFDTYSSVNLKPDQVAAINQTVTDLERWRKVLEDWSLSDWKATNIRGMLDRYSSGRTARDERPGGNGRPADERPSLPVYQAPKDRPAPEASKKTLAEKAKEFTT